VCADENPATTLESETQKATLQEVTVTAQRRTESEQDVPYQIAVIGSDQLTQSGIKTIQGLAELVPGLETVDTGPFARGNNNQFSMRGLRTDGTGNELDNWRNGTVAPVSTYLGETPIFFPIVLRDLARVEVLKGPQGTLYGSGSLAGTIRFIPNRPEFGRFSGNVDIEGSHTENSDNFNGQFHAVMNAPLADNLGFRVAGGYERLGGFIDGVDIVQRSNPADETSAPALRVPSDPRSGYPIAPVMSDTNWSEQWYVRPVLRWKASDAVDAELSYMHQRVAVGGAQINNASYPGGTFLFDSTGISPNSVNTYRPGGTYKMTQDSLTPAQNQLDLGALVVTADLGAASLTSSSSAYWTKSSERQPYVDSSIIYNPDGSVALNYYDYYNNYARANGQSTVNQWEDSFIQEVRLVSTWHKPIDYIVGVYYQDQHFNFESITTEPGYTAYVESINGYGLPRPYGDLQYYYPNSSGFHFQDRAIFGELTWHITSRWQATVGARFFNQDFTNRETAYNYYGGGQPLVDLDVDNRNNVKDHILKFNTSYDFTPDLKLYATYSEGFRRGGANALPLTGSYASLPELLNYTPDKSKNYEIGVKGLLFDRSLRYALDVFLINLENFQFNSFSGSAYPAVFNGTEARSKGAEFEMEYQVTRRLTFGLSYAYTDAKVLQGFTIYDLPSFALSTSPPPALVPAVTVQGGSRLPVTPYNSANAMVDYFIPVGGSATVRLHGNLAYRDSAPAYIDQTSARYWVIPSSLVVNARITYDSGNKWAPYLFVNNLTNETVYYGGFGTGQTQPNLFQQRYVGTPRTFGLGLNYTW
jgi:outer membrane receptor protein involved in Fe transport